MYLLVALLASAMRILPEIVSKLPGDPSTGNLQAVAGKGPFWPKRPRNGEEFGCPEATIWKGGQKPVDASRIRGLQDAVHQKMAINLAATVTYVYNCIHMYTYVTCRICQIEEDFKAVESCGIAAVS
jgi:hypothetical protein